MSNFVSVKGSFFIIDIIKPIYTTETYSRVRVNKMYFDKAREHSKYVLVRTPTGEATFLPKAMKKHKIVKEVFKRPNEPMEMYDLDIPHCQKRLDDFYEYAR